MRGRRSRADRRILLLGDVHVPNHDEEAVAVAVNVAREWDADEIWQLGDLCEAGRYSKHPRKSRAEERPHPWLHELEIAGAFWDDFHAAVPRARCHWRLGNHEGRMERALMECAWGEELIDLVSPTTRVGSGRPWLTIHPWARPTDAGPLMILPGRLAAPHGAAEGVHATANHLPMFAPHSVAHGHTHRVAHVVRRLANGLHQHAISPGCLAARQPAWHGERPSGHAHGLGLLTVTERGWSVSAATIEGDAGARWCIVPGLGEVTA